MRLPLGATQHDSVKPPFLEKVMFVTLPFLAAFHSLGIYFQIYCCCCSIEVLAVVCIQSTFASGISFMHFTTLLLANSLFPLLFPPKMRSSSHLANSSSAIFQ